MFRAIVAILLSLSGVARAAEKRTTISEFGLSFDLPGAWSRVPRDDPELAIFRAKDSDEQVTFRVFKFKERIDAKKRRETVDALVEHQQGAERRDMGANVVLQPVKISERDGLTFASHAGVDRATKRPFAAMVLSSDRSAWALFYETLNGSDATFAARAEKVFATVREVKGANRGLP